MFDRTLLDRCDVLRPEMTDDPFGQPQPGTEIAVVSDRPCRLIKTRKWVYKDDIAHGAWVAEFKLVLKPDIPFQRGDIVIVNDERYQIEEFVGRRDHHQAVELKTYEGRRDG